MKSKLILGALVLLLSSQVNAATLDVDADGYLLGASNVIVGYGRYDVEFSSGSCEFLYNGCNDPADFIFNTWSLSIAASQALLDQVFVDGPLGLFDSFPDLTLGCQVTAGGCGVMTPYAYNPEACGDPRTKNCLGPPEDRETYEGFFAFMAHNLANSDHVDDISGPGMSCSDGIDGNQDPTGLCNITADWTYVAPVPVPAAVWLFGTALIGFIGVSRRRKVA